VGGGLSARNGKNSPAYGLRFIAESLTMTKAKELRDMSDEQLDLTVKEAVDKLFRARVQSQTERLDAPSELKRQRRLIARVKTIQTERLQAAAAK
jgi:large subunit ribosomal protein L29